MSGDFNLDPRKIQELRCRPYADVIYRKVFGDAISIIRDGDLVLDKEFAIDVRIILKNGMNLLWQEKFLSKKYAGFGSVTVEYYQNQWTKERGDWFRMGVQLYFVGYEADEGFRPFVLLDWARVTIDSCRDVIHWIHNTNNDGRARASFAYTPIRDLPSDCIIITNYEFPEAAE